MNIAPEERLKRILDMGHRLLAWLEDNCITPEQIENDYGQ